MSAAAPLPLRPATDARWDLVSLGEVMLRLDPGEERITTARTFRAREGGGEYNVARALRRCFGLRTAIVTALVDNAIGRLIEDLMRQGGVDLQHVRWLPFDGVGRACRNGLYFAERGFGLRGGLGCYDRGHTAIAQLAPGDIDWDAVFAAGVRWFHTGGVFCGLSDSALPVAKEAMQAARRHGAVVSYDLNYRESLWRSRGGRGRADAANRELLPLVDVVFGIDGLADDPSAAEPAGIARAIERTRVAFPQLKIIATPLRAVRSASRHDLGGLCDIGGTVYRAPLRENLEVLDRIGSGDAFAAGLIHGFLAGKDPQYAVDCAAALAALTLTTPGDQANATRAEVEALMRGGRPEIVR